ncbi:MAG: SIS domain-containing protein [Ginsengibacter sp.]
MKDYLKVVTLKLQNNSMQLLTLEKSSLRQKKAILTAQEIAGQPGLWESIYEAFDNAASGIRDFLQAAYAESDNIILTGAGTSAFIGLSLEGPFSRNTQIITRAVATTNIVSHPHDYFTTTHTSLVISFARSGNSPESCAALNLADKFSGKCFHLIITCDKDGALAHYDSSNPTYVFILPEAANDKSLAMTGSYTGMLLTGLMTAYIHQEQKIKEQVTLVTMAAKNLLSNGAEMIRKIAEKDFKRAVFLGSGNLFGTATEAALKLQELTDGIIVSKEDTYLGLRHGPKAVIDESTLVVCFFSNNNYVKKYEEDMVSTMKSGNNVMFQFGVSENFKAINGLDAQINFGVDSKNIEEDFLPVCAILAGQLLGFYKSLQLGLAPDNPSVYGSISRVVKGVNIYPAEIPTPVMNYK